MKVEMGGQTIVFGVGNMKIKFLYNIHFLKTSCMNKQQIAKMAESNQYRELPSKVGLAPIGIFQKKKGSKYHLYRIYTLIFLNQSAKDTE